MFDNFMNFAFAQDMVAEPLTVTVHGRDSGKRDEHGQPVKATDQVLHVNEGITNSTNPNLSFNMVDGGQMPVGTLYWLSHTPHLPKGTTVVRDVEPSVQYQTINSGADIQAGLTYYQLKEMGSNG